MRGWSFPIGRILGVDVRIHTFFLLLLGLSISYATMTGASGARGFALWLLLLLAVAVREIARALGAAWYGLELRSILLLPTGGLMSYATPEANELAATPEMQKRMGVIGPIANFLFGLALAAIALSFAPDVSTLRAALAFTLSPSPRRRLGQSALRRTQSSSRLAPRRWPRLPRRICENKGESKARVPPQDSARPSPIS